MGFDTARSARTGAEAGDDCLFGDQGNDKLSGGAYDNALYDMLSASSVWQDGTDFNRTFSTATDCGGIDFSHRIAASGSPF